MKNVKELLNVMIIVLLLFFAGCALQPESDSNNTNNNVNDSDGLNSDVNSQNIQQFDIEAFNFGYSPTEIRVKRGDAVRIDMAVIEGNHDFVIDEFGVKTPITASGESVSVDFVPTDVGEYFFYCSVGNHRAMGMEGILIVE